MEICFLDQGFDILLFCLDSFEGFNKTGKLQAMSQVDIGILELTYFENNLIDANNIFQRGSRFVEALADPMHIGHHFEILVLSVKQTVQR